MLILLRDAEDKREKRIRIDHRTCKLLAENCKVTADVWKRKGNITSCQG